MPRGLILNEGDEIKNKVQKIGDEKKLKNIIRKPLFTTYALILIPGFLYIFTLHESESIAGMNLIIGMLLLGVTSYFAYRLKKKWYWLFLGATPLFPLGYWITPFVMYWLYSKEK